MSDEAPIGESRAVGAIELPLRFTGTAGEYFRIWIVNLALTIVTIGIWSAWAKVRRKRFFHGHTTLADASFGYHGTPGAILRGRVIAVGLYLLIYLAAQWSGWFGVAGVLVFAFAFPWLVCRAHAFNAANTSHRGLRFRFTGRAAELMREASVPMIVPVVLLIGGAIYFDGPGAPTDPKADGAGPLDGFFGLAVLVAIFFWPAAYAVFRAFQINHHWYGSARFQTTVSTTTLYRYAAIAFGLPLLLLLALLMLVGLLGGFEAADPQSGGRASGAMMLIVLLLGVAAASSYLLYPFIWGYFRARVDNHILGNTRLDKLRLSCRLGARRLGWIYLSNWLAVALSFGLLYPWSAVRLVRYRVESLSVHADDAEELARITAQAARAGSATGGEIGEVFDLDLGL